MRVKDDKKIEQIFNGTLELIEKSGLAGITISDISKHASIATGTLYIYFKNKEELINELFSRCRKQSAGYYFNDFNENDEVEIAFKKIFLNIINYKKTHFKQSVFLEQYYHSPYINEKKRQESSRQLQPFHDVMNKGIKSGLLKETDNLLFLWYVIGIINEVIKGMHYRKRILTNEDIEVLYKMCWDGMKC